MRVLLLWALLAWPGWSATRIVVTVVEQKSGNPVTDLNAGDFTMLDDKTPRQVEAAEFAKATLDIMLLLDTSLAGPMVQPVVENVIGQLEPKEQMAMVAFASAADLIQDFTSSRELLVGEILWSLCGPLMDQSAASVRTRGARRVAAICEATIRAILAFAPLRRFMQSDPEGALRLLTSKQGPVQGRAIEKVRELLAYEAQRGALDPPLGVDTLAYLIVRICESFIYAEAISDQKIDVGDAALAVELLLSGRVRRSKAQRKNGM